jgi:hypothetical protein
VGLVGKVMSPRKCFFFFFFFFGGTREANTPLHKTRKYFCGVRI